MQEIHEPTRLLAHVPEKMGKTIAPCVTWIVHCNKWRWVVSRVSVPIYELLVYCIA